MACEGVRAENEPVFISRYGRALGASGVRYKLDGYVAAAAKVSRVCDHPCQINLLAFKSGVYRTMRVRLADRIGADVEEPGGKRSK